MLLPFQVAGERSHLVEIKYCNGCNQLALFVSSFAVSGVSTGADFSLVRASNVSKSTISSLSKTAEECPLRSFKVVLVRSRILKSPDR
jgi:hypothetical protein